MSDNTIVLLVITLVILFLVILVIVLIKSNKKHMRKIIETTTPIWVEFIDILVFKISTGDDTLTVYYPVFKSKKDNKIYIASRFGNYGNLYPTTEGYFTENPKIFFKNINKEVIEVNKEGRLYIEKEKNPVNVENNKIIIEERKLQYAGKYQKAMKLNEIYSVYNDNILDLVNGAVIYYGIADFDMEGILREYIN